MRIALDATYSIGSELSGVGIYSREILNGLAAGIAADLPIERWEWFYRSQRYWRALRIPKPPNVKCRFLSDSWGSRSAQLFHGLNQRLPRLKFPLQITTFHDLFVLSGEYSTPEFRERFAKQAREAAARADLIIAVSAFTASQVESYLNVMPSRIRVIHHGVLTRAIPERNPQKIVLCVGAIQKRKNQAALVRAFNAMPDGWQLVLAGSYGYGAEETFRAVAESPRADRIHVTGYLTEEQLSQWYARASIFAFPSRDEGFGMPVLEAMAAGVPVIAGNRSALPEVCGDAAVLVDPESEDDLASALLLVSGDHSFSRALIVRGRQRAARFPWSKAVTDTLEIYREVLQTSSSTAIRKAFRNR